MTLRKRLYSILLAVSTTVQTAGAFAQASPPPTLIPQAHEEVTLQNGSIMVYDQNISIPMRDGSFVYANVFQPKKPGKYPVIMAQGPYGKDATFQEAYADGWKKVLQSNPSICAKSTCRYLRWEHTDPERWVGDGYVVIAVDVRGAGYTPGYLDLLSVREARDFYDGIEWAGTQPWSNGKVGLLGISYMAINQWQVAALRPPHLAAIAPWEGASDLYRESSSHGGIESNLFVQLWFKNQILPNQNGNEKTTYKDPGTRANPTGAPLSAAMLIANRNDPMEMLHKHPLLDGYNLERNAQLNRIQVPLLSAGNLAGAGLHGRGNYEGFVQAGSPKKWLELHTGTHDDSFYGDEGIELQHRFFGRYLKGLKNGWEKTPPITLVVRDLTKAKFEVRTEQEWPIARTQWTRAYLDAKEKKLSEYAPSTESTSAFQAGTTAANFDMTFDNSVELTGPLAARLWIASSTTDADLFATLQIFDEHGKEVTFLGANDEAAPIAQGWLRASHRKLDQVRSKPYQPWHAHDEVQKLNPGEFYAVDVEFWPTSITVHPGYRLTLRVEGRDFQRPLADGTPAASPVYRGSGIFLHTDPYDRPMPEFGGVTTIATGPQHESYLTLPVVPKK